MIDELLKKFYLSIFHALAYFRFYLFKLLYRVRIGRNLEGFALCPAMTQEQRIEVEEILRKAVSSLEDDLKGEYFQLSEMDEAKQQELTENKFLFTSGDPNLSVAGMERDWPENRGLFFNDAKSLLAWINEEDHLRIIAMESGMNEYFSKTIISK